jgi:tripartite-type tricarboxylate transporter receptor subunit TctC
MCRKSNGSSRTLIGGSSPSIRTFCNSSKLAAQNVRRSFVILGLAALSGISGSAAWSQSLDEFYRSKRNVELISPSEAGSAYTVWARVVARYMQEYLPGKPNIIVKTMPGGGGITAGNYIYGLAPKDGTSFGMISRNLPLQAFLRQQGVRYDPRQFSWIGSIETSNRSCAVLASAGVRNVRDLLQREVIVGGTGAGSGQSFLPTVVNQLAGTKFKVVEGYKGADDIHLAIERKEVDGICGLHDTTVRQFEQKIRSGEMLILFNLERERLADMKDVPSIEEFITDPQKKQIFEFIASPAEMGRPFVAPPEVPSERIAVLKNAFERMAADQNFLTEAARLKLNVQVTSGEALAKLVADLYATPKTVVEEALKLMPKDSLR